MQLEHLVSEFVLEPHGDNRAQLLYRILREIDAVSKKRLPEGVELGDLVWLYQKMMEEFVFLKCCDDLSVKENAILKGVKTQKWDDLTFCHH